MKKPLFSDPKMSLGNLEYLEKVYTQYLKDPLQLEPEWRWFFRGLDFASVTTLKKETTNAQLKKELGVFKLLYTYREHGFLKASLDPLEIKKLEGFPKLEDFSLKKEDLNQPFSAIENLFGKNITLANTISFLEKTYCGTIALQVGGSSPEVQDWFFNEFEKQEWSLKPKEKKQVFLDLTKAHSLENFLHFRFMGKKRFSLEGLDVLIPMMEYLLKEGTKLNVKEMAIGMAHRGRLNMLAHFMKQDLRLIFSKFEDNLKNNLFNGGDWTGDVKYHLGFSSKRDTPNGSCSLYMGYNPSHLEAINPVLSGIARAMQRRREDTKTRKTVLPILIHGDAAFCGQGVVSETLQLSQLKGYTVGGTLHIILNNQLGFTTSPEEGRSTLFPSDLAKSIQAPQLLVNADDVEASLKAIKMALKFRQHFGLDVFVELIGYRRHGHNEGDEPSFTQPTLYAKIKKHPPVLEKYKKQLMQENLLSEEEAENTKKNYEKELEKTLKEALHLTASDKKNLLEPELPKATIPSLQHTRTTKKNLISVLNALSKEPENFNLHPKIKKLLSRRRHLIEKNQLDWSLCELAAYGTLLQDGFSIRLTGQDSKRGTFSHRQAIYFDTKNDSEFSPLRKLVAPNNKECCIYNSPLSEMAALGFEYGNSCMAADFLTVWEAQFGDFINSAQVIIDQFISSGESKWLQNTDIILLLPHGYEGQGPEHSSGNLERFLQLSAQKNMRVCNLTSPGNLFHAIRRQKTSPRVPLIIMAPKSLLRHPEMFSAFTALCEQEFQEILGEKNIPNIPKTVTHIILCSGKVYYDLKNHPEFKASSDKINQIAIFRLEQLYPFPKTRLNPILNGFSSLEKIIWLQEEPKNRGAWFFVEPRLRKLLKDLGQPGISIEYAGRPSMAAPAEGSQTVHKREQDLLIKRVLAEIH